MDTYWLKKNKLFTIILVLAILVIISMLIFLYIKPAVTEDSGPEITYKNITKTVTEIKTIQESVPANLSFEEYILSPQAFVGNEITLTGFLKHGKKTVDDVIEYYYAIVDDFGNEVHLLRLNEREKVLFKDNDITDEIYQISGIARYSFQKFEIDVTDFQLSDRPMITMDRELVIEKNVTEQVPVLVDDI